MLATKAMPTASAAAAAAALLQERIAGLESVLEVTQHLAAERNLDRLLELIIDHACRALQCERASLFLYDEPRDELYTRKVTELESLEEIRLPLSAGIVGLTARERRLIHVPRPYEHTLFNSGFDQQTGFRTRNILCAPLAACRDGKLLGVLQLLNRRDGAFTSHDEQLLEAYAGHAAIAVERAMLAQCYEESLRVQHALQTAREVQAAFFPATLPAIPGYELAAASRPADATGGDYYDALRLPSGRLGLAMADVCGHGLGPSLLMASLRAMLRGLAQRGVAPDAMLSDLSAALDDDLRPQHRFITLLYGELDPASHTFQFANAGHGPVALHWQEARGEFRLLTDDEARGCPLGLWPQQYQACAAVPLGPGDMLVLGTDGLVEARRGSEQFGLPRLCEQLRARRQQPVQQQLESLLTAAEDFQDGGRPLDDLTLMIVRRA